MLALHINTYIYIYTFMAHHFIFLQLNPFDLRVDRDGGLSTLVS